MTVYIDPPLWAAHGTTFSHVISDESLSELHGFAHRVGVRWRAFDLDHFDVPAERYRALINAGARPVSANELTRKLISSGLRLPRHDRGGALERRLRDQWDELLPGQPELGAQLLALWREPGRYYHDVRHLFAVLENIDLLSPAAPDVRVLALAAWFHDAVYRGNAQDEEASAQLAERELSAAGVAEWEVAEVARLVRLTATHAPEPGDHIGHILCDADLAILASPWSAYERYLIGVRSDYAHVPDTDFAIGRAAVLRSLQELPQLFHTNTGKLLWETPARENLARELELYIDGLPGWLSRTPDPSAERSQR